MHLPVAPMIHMKLHQIHVRTHVLSLYLCFCFGASPATPRSAAPSRCGSSQKRIMRRTGKRALAERPTPPAIAPRHGPLAGIMRAKTYSSRLHLCELFAKLSSRLKFVLHIRASRHPYPNIHIEQSAPLHACARSVEQRKNLLQACFRSIKQLHAHF